MFNLFKRKPKPRIIQFNPSLSGHDQGFCGCRVLSFKYHNPDRKRGDEDINLRKNPGHCKLDFIWDHLEARNGCY
jgi:hypothetical protein